MLINKAPEPDFFLHPATAMPAWPVRTAHHSEDPLHSICVMYFTFVNTTESNTYKHNY